VLVFAFCGALGAPSASAWAAQTHEPESFSPLTGSGSGVTIHEPSGIGLDEVTGNVLITDSAGNEVGEGSLLILGDENGAPTGLTAPFSISGFSFIGNTPQGLTYDNSATSAAEGSLYVYDQTVQAIKRFTRNSATERFEEEGAAIPVPGAGKIVGLGLDVAGNIYLGSFSAKAVYKFSPAGVPIHKWSYPAELPVSFPGQVAVDAAGDLFIQGQGQGGVWKCPVGLAEVIAPASCEKLTTATATGVAYDGVNDHVFLALGTRVAEYDATTLEKISEFGKEGILGEEPVLRSTERIAIDDEQERIYVVDAGGKDVVVFGPAVAVPTARATAAGEVTGTKATLNGLVNPEGNEVSECLFEYGETTTYGNTAPCEGGPLPVDEEGHPVAAKISGLLSNGHTYHYRLRARNGNGTEKSVDKTLVTASTVVTEAATSVISTTATLHGTVRPEGQQYSSCSFEWGLATAAGFEHTTACRPVAAEIEPDFAAHPVTLPLSGLEPNTTYKFRLSTTNPGGTLTGQTLTFVTIGPPQITEIRASGASQSTAKLEAKINPSGFATSYRFEWGPTAAYQYRIPAEFELPLEAGKNPIAVSASLTGLASGATYHYRIVASSGEGRETASPDETFETLNSCGYPEARCLEMVSPKELGPAAQVGRFLSGAELHYQASEEQGSLAWAMEAGLPEATRGAELLYQGTRSAGGWANQQLNPPILARGEQNSGSSVPNQFIGFSKDLGCGVFASLQPVAGDPPAAGQILAAGGANLYRRNSDGSTTLITAQPPQELSGANTLVSEFELIGISANCSKIVFSTKHHYPGAGGAGSERLYEWEAGTGIRSAGIVPKAGGGEEAVEATAGSPVIGQSGDRRNAVSLDGSRIFFSAKRLTGALPAEVGKTGVFVREGGIHTVEVSASETSTPDEGANYEAATPDGQRVYFTANAGLTAESSPEGRDLYEYDFGAPAGERLTDLSATEEAGGARVGPPPEGALVGAGDDGSHVYFVARGQLDPGRGPTLAENEAANTYSLYDHRTANEENRFVGTVSGVSGKLKLVTVGKEAESASRVSHDGRYLLFESTTKNTAYDSGGVSEAYLYNADAVAGEEATVCVSCRQDGGVPVSGGFELGPLPLATNSNRRYQPQSLVVRDGKPVAFFRSKDALAPGGTEGIWNLYEWSHGQVFHVASEVPGTATSKELTVLFFAGASADGTDMYFFDGAPLNWEDPEGRPAAWDARIGGGFAEPPAPLAACNASAEGSCQGPVSAAPNSLGAATNTSQGSGNVKAKHQKRKHRKQHKKKGKGNKHRGKARTAKHHGNGRAGK
jgi:hypothetical protein